MIFIYFGDSPGRPSADITVGIYNFVFFGERSAVHETSGWVFFSGRAGMDGKIF